MAVGLPLVGAVAAAALWLRSGVVTDRVLIGTGDYGVVVSSADGRVGLSVTRWTRPKPRGVVVEHARVFRPAANSGLFGWSAGSHGYFECWCPHLLVVIAGAATAVVLFHRRQATVRLGACLGCGYDLRATPERCPECGLLVAVGMERKRATLGTPSTGTERVASGSVTVTVIVDPSRR